MFHSLSPDLPHRTEKEGGKGVLIVIKPTFPTLDQKFSWFMGDGQKAALPQHLGQKEGEGAGAGLLIIFGKHQPKMLLFGRSFSTCAADGAAAVAVPVPPLSPVSPRQPQDHPKGYSSSSGGLILPFFGPLQPPAVDFSTLQGVHRHEKPPAVPKRGTDPRGVQEAQPHHAEMDVPLKPHLGASWGHWHHPQP